MKKILLFIGGILILALVGYFAITNLFFQKEAPFKYSGPIEKIRIGNIGEYSIFNLIAEEKGFFLQNGLDAQIKEYSSGPAAMAGLLAGEVDVNISADFVGVRNIFDYPQIRMLAVVNQHRVFQLATKKDGKIRSIADIEGKKIGITKNSAGEFFLSNFLAFNKLEPKDVTIVDLTPQEMIAQLLEGKIDGIVLFEPHIFKLKNQLGDNFQAWNVQGNQSSNALLWSTKNFLDENSKVVKRYMQALVRAEKHYKENPKEVEIFLNKKLGRDAAYVDYAVLKFTHAITLHQELLIHMESQGRWVMTRGLTSKKSVPNYLDYIYFDALEQSKPEAINIIY